jgi:hypothetical protein
LLAALATISSLARAAEGDLLLEMHFKPVPRAQLAIWLEDAEGAWVQDVLVTQATGKLGIGNRPGEWNFVSSWRAPYGPRPSVLPVWAHRRGKTYPKLVFYDGDPDDGLSLGWHENSSSPETYFCRPLTASEHATISVDSMTCPSPASFQSDKGAFHPTEKSYYPPRNDLLEFEGTQDSPDARTFAALNDLDAVTAATPPGDTPEYVLTVVPAAAVAKGPLRAYIEVSLEHDENATYDYDRDNDHLVDPRLDSYGIEYLGQPSVVYTVTVDPRVEGFVGTSQYAGHGDWNGATGTLHPPDAGISTSEGSGADRLREYDLNGERFRFGAYSYGADGAGGDDGWGHCKPATLAPVTGLSVEGMSFDRVRVRYTVPRPSDPEFELSRVHVYLLPGSQPLTNDRLGAAIQRTFGAADAGTAGVSSSVEVDQLWGDFTYQVGVVYEDRCAHTSALVTTSITTEAQQFQQVEGFCFLATAAYGASWVSQVQALRYFRDAYLLKNSTIGRDLVRFYYSYSPPLARVVRRQAVLRGMVRVVLAPLTDLARLGAGRG